jgi:hypothetical protein
MTTAVVGPGTPYVTPEILKSAPTGISWGTIPRRDSTNASNRAEMLNMCQRATALVDQTCNQVIRATVDTEQLQGPDFRITVQSGGLARVTLSRWPVLRILGGEIAQTNVFPRQWQSIPGDQFDIEYPIIGLAGTNTPSAAGEGGQAVVLAPGWLNFANGRNGYTLRTTYVNGWPHAGLTAPATAGDQFILVDDTTGWAPIEVGGQGATGTLQNGQDQESFTVVSSNTTTGPGELTLAVPLEFDHPIGVAATTLPDSLVWAAILFCASQALTRGASSTGVQSATPGATGGGGSPKTFQDEAEKRCRAFGRVW